VCIGHELERDAQIDQRRAQEEIRRLFERYRRIGREGEPDRTDAPREDDERHEEPVLTAH
jgi:hypothetical protein